jgi:predicted ATP-grasp superfamily ATP-dependent carboligase
VLFPTDDASLLTVSKYKQELATHYRIAAEDWGIVRPLLEKTHTYEIAERHGIPCPRIQAIDNRNQALDFACEVGFPCIIKPSVGHKFFERYKAKMVFAHTPEEFSALLDDFEGYDEQLMVSEFIPGEDTAGANYNSFYNAGAPTQEFTAQKLRLKPSRIGFPIAVVSRNLPEVVELGRKVINAIGLNGFSCTEFKKDSRDNIYKLMEVNARPNFSGMLALRCGINFPYMSYQMAVGQAISSKALHAAQEVYWIDEERDISGMV